MKPIIYRWIAFSTAILATTALLLGGCGGSQNTSSTPTNTGNSITVNLTAQNIAFSLSTITVPAGALVTVNFDNEDAGIQHNFAVYTDSTATTNIFKGQVTTGVMMMTYTFTAPSTSGTYFFRCDIHPTQMTGTFIVQ